MIKFMQKAIIFCLFFIIILQTVTVLLTPKTYSASANLNESFSLYSLANKITGFYEIPANTLDVVFLGSSHVHVNVNPLAIYNEYGIMGYDFSADQQDFQTSYYYAEEVFKKQQPQVLAVECGIFCEKQALTSGHFSFDFLPLVSSKIEGILERQAKENYKEMFLPIYAYHTRWKELTDVDFKYFTADRQHYFMGHWAYLPMNPQTVEPNQNITESRELTEQEQESIDKLYQLCKENSCQLVLFKTPSAVGNIWQTTNNALKEYIEEKEYDIVFEDYSFSDIGMDYEKHFVDSVHMNIYGAERFSKVFGELLTKYVEPNRNQSTELVNTFDISWTYYSRLKANYEFSLINDYSKYMNSVCENKDYVAFIVGQCDPTLSGVKINETFISENPYWSYCALVENGSYVFEEFGSERIQEEFIYGDDIYTLVSDPHAVQGSVLVNYRDEKSKLQRGINVVVYDKQTGDVIDVKNFDIYLLEPMM